MVQYQIVWFTGFCCICMHDLSGWVNSTPLKASIVTKMLFFSIPSSCFKMVVAIANRKSTLLDLKDDDNIVLKFIPE